MQLFYVSHPAVNMPTSVNMVVCVLVDSDRIYASQFGLDLVTFWSILTRTLLLC